MLMWRQINNDTHPQNSYFTNKNIKWQRPVKIKWNNRKQKLKLIKDENKQSYRNNNNGTILNTLLSETLFPTANRCMIHLHLNNSINSTSHDQVMAGRQQRPEVIYRVDSFDLYKIENKRICFPLPWKRRLQCWVLPGTRGWMRLWSNPCARLVFLQPTNHRLVDWASSLLRNRREAQRVSVHVAHIKHSSAVGHWKEWDK